MIFGQIYHNTATMSEISRDAIFCVRLGKMICKSVHHWRNFCPLLYLRFCVFHIGYTGLSYLISLNPMLLKNIAHVGTFKHFVFVYLRICVIVYLCIIHLIHGNVINDILESHAFQEYSTCRFFKHFVNLNSEKSERVDCWALLDQDKHCTELVNSNTRGFRVA